MADNHIESKTILDADSKKMAVVPAHPYQLSLGEKQQHTATMLGWNDSILAGQVSQSTRVQYAQDFYDYLRFAGTVERALDPATFSLWRTHLTTRLYEVNQQQTKLLSPNTINRMISAVKHMFQEAEEKGLVPVGTYERFSRVRGVKVKALKERLKTNARVRIEPEEMRQLTEQPDIERLLGLRDQALLHTFGSGLRVSELCSITLQRIRKQGRGYVVEVRGKNQTDYRPVPLSKEAYAAIMEWTHERPIESDYVFTSFAGRGEGIHTRLTLDPITRQGAWQIIKNYAASVGLKDVKPHDLRRFVGTQLAKKNPRLAQNVLGHASIATTFKHYVLDDLPEDATEGLY